MKYKVKNYMKLLAGFLTLWSLLSISTFTHKYFGKLPENNNQKKKEKVTVGATETKQQLAANTTDTSSFLFVDCTGFFE